MRVPDSGDLLLKQECLIACIHKLLRQNTLPRLRHSAR